MLSGTWLNAVGMTADEVLRVERLRAYYTSKRGLVRAVEDVSFSVNKGQCVALFGESGAGKTSVALAILGLFDRAARYYASVSGDEENKQLWRLRDEAKAKGLTSREMGLELPGVEGHIWFEGRDLLSLDETELRRIRGNRITYVPQGTRKSMNPYLTVEQQTAEPMRVHDEDGTLTRDEAMRRVLEALRLVELNEVDIRRLQKPPDLSVGEDQRVLIAMALVTRPSLLIADEPATAVDVGVRSRIIEALEIARSEMGLAMLLISNDQGIVADLADQVAVMSAGRIMEFGTAERVLLSPGHPFTRAFLMSNPSMEILRRIREKGLRIRGIPGSPPDPVSPPQGCPFHPRCQFADDLCGREVPEYRQVEEGHWVFCHKYEELPEW